MFELKGKYTTALITTDNIEEEAISQVVNLINHPASLNSKIVIMPDVHAGAGCVIGTTMTITDRVVPNLVGVDIGCGVVAYKIPAKDIDFAKLQAVIDAEVPSGMHVHEKENPLADRLLDGISTKLTQRTQNRIICSLGTLGGGNHFISVESDGIDSYLIIHTGSRNLGLQVAHYHQDKAEEIMKNSGIQALIETLKATGRAKDIQKEVEAYKIEHEDEFSRTKGLAFLTGEAMKDYLQDLGLAQRFASLNRFEIAKTIFNGMEWTMGDFVESVHNYIDLSEMVLRKGAINAVGMFLVPLNMRDGTVLCRGKENSAWNNSAPHGAGRAMSRSTAKKTLDLEDFKDTMKDIWSASVNVSTLDEAPDAYKPAEEIKRLVSEQYEVVAHLKTLFNFKAQD
jgi:tRNA-splicing ligase RtcB (3'-phosphate/5'-hydroxy nucleic acid ligase)